ncbi:MAG: hypothetical protein V2A61_00050 [Calditrichota bacterium]
MPDKKSNPKAFDASDWDAREFEWTGKSFYYISIINIFGKPFGLSEKLVDLNRELRQNGYRPLNNIVLIEHALFKGKIMVEVEKLDKYDDHLLTFEIQTTADSIVIHTGMSGLAKGVERLKQRIVNRRDMNPRGIYYWLVNSLGSSQIVVFGLT